MHYHDIWNYGYDERGKYVLLNVYVEQYKDEECDEPWDWHEFSLDELKGKSINEAIADFFGENGDIDRG